MNKSRQVTQSVQLKIKYYCAMFGESPLLVVSQLDAAVVYRFQGFISAYRGGGYFPSPPRLFSPNSKTEQKQSRIKTIVWLEKLSLNEKGKTDIHIRKKKLLSSSSRPPTARLRRRTHDALRPLGIFPPLSRQLARLSLPQPLLAQIIQVRSRRPMRVEAPDAHPGHDSSGN